LNAVASEAANIVGHKLASGNYANCYQEPRWHKPHLCTPRDGLQSRRYCGVDLFWCRANVGLGRLS
jgi:hypothetical protein